jgi:hypothetical protein
MYIKHKNINQVVNSTINNLSENDIKNMVEEPTISNQPLFTQKPVCPGYTLPLRMIAYNDMKSKKVI